MFLPCKCFKNMIVMFVSSLKQIDKQKDWILKVPIFWKVKILLISDEVVFYKTTKIKLLYLNESSLFQKAVKAWVKNISAAVSIYSLLSNIPFSETQWTSSHYMVLWLCFYKMRLDFKSGAQLLRELKNY